MRHEPPLPRDQSLPDQSHVCGQEDLQASLDPDRCSGCAICVSRCPRGAVREG
ncbi:MAG: 4Fe-4S binding protein [Thermoplasmata archaeon]